MEARVGLKEEEEGLVWMTAAAACCQKESVQFGQLETYTQVVLLLNVFEWAPGKL